MSAPRPDDVPVMVLSPDPSADQEVIRPLREGGLRVESVPEAGRVRRQAADRQPFVAVIDLDAGADAVELVRDVGAPTRRIVLLATPRHRQTAARLMRLGAASYVLKPVLPTEILVHVERARGEVLAASALRRDRSRERDERRADAFRTDRRAARLLAATLRHRDGETSAHMERVGRCSAAIAGELGWSTGDSEGFRLAASLHDLGKIGLPDGVLEKPGRLTPEEFRIVTRHPRIGAAILDTSLEPGDELSFLHIARTVCLHHHERWDGGGYPAGLSREKVPWEARVVAVADVYDALLQDRPYRDAVPEPVALAYVRFQRGRRFDPRVVDAFFEILPRLRAIREERPDRGVSRVAAAGGGPRGRWT